LRQSDRLRRKVETVVGPMLATPRGRDREQVRGKSMHVKAVATTALALALGMIANPWTAARADDDGLKRITQAAYFSQPCRQDAERLGIPPTRDANSLFAAYVARRRAPDAGFGDCQAPVVLLINLFRLNGVDAEIAFIMMTPARTAGGGVSFGRIDRVIVYVPAVDRYLDPAAPLGKQDVLDRIIRERAGRGHLVGPSVAGDKWRACPATCLYEYIGSNESAVRVKTEAIRGP
jgi:hypothetical protein